MKASYLLKANIETLLRARHQTKHDLAMWCRRSDGWLSKILGKDQRNLPLAYLDRIADFFGVATYQLFQPGIAPLSERRKAADRRSGKDRRLRAAQPGTVTAADVALDAKDVALLLRIRSLPQGVRADMEKTIAEQGMPRKRRARRAEGSGAAAHASSPEMPPSTAVRPASHLKQG